VNDDTDAVLLKCFGPLSVGHEQTLILWCASVWLNIFVILQTLLRNCGWSTTQGLIYLLISY